MTSRQQQSRNGQHVRRSRRGERRRARAWMAGAVAFASFAFASFAPTAAVLGATLNWDPGLTASANGGGTGTWNPATGNWFNGTSDVAWTDTAGAADVASFGGTSGTVTLGTNLGALGVVFTAPGYTISGGG